VTLFFYDELHFDIFLVKENEGVIIPLQMYIKARGEWIPTLERKLRFLLQNNKLKCMPPEKWYAQYRKYIHFWMVD